MFLVPRIDQKYNCDSVENLLPSGKNLAAMLIGGSRSPENHRRMPTVIQRETELGTGTWCTWSPSKVC